MSGPYPLFCHQCGAPYPWLAGKLDAARELTNLLGGLTDEEKSSLSSSLIDITTDTPRTSLAATRVKILLSKATGEAKKAVRDIIIDIASEAAKKALFG